MPDILEINGQRYIPAEQASLPDWPVAATDGYSQPILTLKDNDLFLMTDLVGNISGSRNDDAITNLGLFCQDTRFLSRLELQFERRSPILLSSTARSGFTLSALCANPHIEDHIRAETIGIQREMVLNGGLFEELTITNYRTRPTSFEISLSFGSDFVDLFEIRGKQRPQRGELMWALANQQDGASGQQQGDGSFPHTLTLAYQGEDGALRESRIEFAHRRPDRLEGTTAVWQLDLEPHETVLLGYRLNLLVDGSPASTVSLSTTLMQAKASEAMEEQDWDSRVTRIRSDSRSFNQLIEQAEKDIYLLRQTFDGRKALSAGVPWFATLFGRDSIIAASQTLILDPTIACETLAILAHYQGQEFNDWRDEEPGKILHELRLGEMARCNEVPHTPYYGTVDATPLWLMLYAEYYEWTHDRDTLDRLWENALAAMAWIDRSLEETGYLTYQRRSPQGLPNQGWKDSDDCHVDAKGQLIDTPIALCEPQAYAYAAKMRLSAIARLQQRADLADQWQDDARALKQRFNRDFWMPEAGYYAFALDGTGRPARSITSNPGHCLYLDILPEDRIQSVAERLQAPDMFSGWGIRTLSSRSPAYNPMGYHVGSVWPHDNSLIAIGLRSLGLVDQAMEIAQGIFDMTFEQPYYRPPELFCGHERTPGGSPIRYPVACSPQAWASGSIFQLLQMSLNLVPHAPQNTLLINNPTLPKSISCLMLENLRVGSTILDLEFERSEDITACRVVKKRGNLRVVIEA
ncbi:MAG: amylo-alpha-1,6-glucosidase [Synechococcales bacterium]|nr:amylo-alpha-1,6-glucosidase [Synechococcales bacterium]